MTPMGSEQAEVPLCHGIVAVIPAHDEELSIGSVILRARKYAQTVIVVDDGSTDATAEIARAAGAIVLRHERNRGKGAAISTGIRRALELAPGVVAILDADGQHRPEELPSVVAPILREEADIVVGSRYLQRGRDVPRHRRWGHWAFTSLTNLASRVRVTDSQSGFRALSPQAAAAVAFSSEGFSVESEMQFWAHEHGLRLAETPVTALYNRRPKRSVVAHGLMVLNGLLRLMGQYRPLLFFGVPGSLLALGGLAWGVWVVDIYHRTQELAIGYAMISVLLFIVGSLCLFTGIILHSVRALLLELKTPVAHPVPSGNPGPEDP